MRDRENRYLRDRMMTRDMRRGVAGSGRGRSRDYEGERHIGNPDGRTRVSGYLRRSRDNAYDRNDYERDYDMRDYTDMHSGSGYNYADDVYQYEDSRRNDYYPMDMTYDSRDRRRDYRSRDYIDEYRRDYADMDENYKRDLEEWSKKLKRKDRFGLTRDEILKQAKQMGVEFKDYNEDEYITVYYMLMSDFKDLSNSPQQYLILAKQWLEDEDAEMRGSEKLCAHFYTIILGE